MYCPLMKEYISLIEIKFISKITHDAYFILFYSNFNQVHVCGNSITIPQNTALRFFRKIEEIRIKSWHCLQNVFKQVL